MAAAKYSSQYISDRCVFLPLLLLLRSIAGFSADCDILRSSLLTPLAHSLLPSKTAESLHLLSLHIEKCIVIAAP